MKTEFFSNVSHELRTPLTMILTPVDRLLDRGDSLTPGPAAKMLQMVRLNGYRLLDLDQPAVGFLQARSWADEAALERRGCECARAKADHRGHAVGHTAEYRAGDHIAIPAIGLFGADEEKVETVIANFISNAMKFTPHGGRVQRRNACRAGPHVDFCHRYGIGIDESQRDRIFQRFVQVDGSSSREFSGTGLGTIAGAGTGATSRRRHPRRQCSWAGFAILVRSCPIRRAGQRNRLRIEPDSHDQRWRAALPNSTVHRRRARPSRRAARYSAATSHTRCWSLTIRPDMRALLSELLKDEYRVLVARDGQEGSRNHAARVSGSDSLRRHDAADGRPGVLPPHQDRSSDRPHPVCHADRQVRTCR